MSNKEVEIEVLPTGRSHVSFSEVKTWLDCGWLYKLTHIDKLLPFDEQIYSDFGKILHDACENYLMTRVMDIELAKQKMSDVWTQKNYPDVPNWPQFKSAVPELEYWLTCIENILSAIPDFLAEHFPDWKVHDAEERMKTQIEGETLSFKGFIDGILEVQKGKSTEFWIIDWKTASHAGWHYTKKRDTDVHLQLILYKHFWCIKHDVDPKRVKCAFILLKRDDPDPKKRAKGLKERCSLLKVSVGPKTTEKALRKVDNMIKSVRKQFFLKNRNNCKFCPFYDTENCRSF